VKVASGPQARNRRNSLDLALEGAKPVPSHYGPQNKTIRSLCADIAGEGPCVTAASKVAVTDPRPIPLKVKLPK
jgi:hypothetical protein